MRDSTSTIFLQAYAAEQKAAKAAEKPRCDEYKMDKKGKCPGDTGYVSFVKDDVPKDFAVSRSAPYSFYSVVNERPVHDR